jgi:hypothetical protein
MTSTRASALLSSRFQLGCDFIRETDGTSNLCIASAGMFAPCRARSMILLHRHKSETPRLQASILSFPPTSGPQMAWS